MSTSPAGLTSSPQASFAAGKVKIADSDQNPLGEIRLAEIEEKSFHKGLFSFTDINTLNGTHKGDLVLVDTITPASLDTKSVAGLSSVYNLTIRLNETVQWDYNLNVTTRFLGIRLFLSPIRLNAIYMNYTTLVSSDKYFVNESSFSSDALYFGDSQVRQNIYYNFTQEYVAHNNGSIILTYQYDYNIPISNWECTNLDSAQYLTKSSQNIIQHYVNNITLGEPTRALNIIGTFNVSLPDRNDIYGVSFDNLNGNVPKINFNYTVVSNSYSVYTDFSYTCQLDFSFKANFTVNIVDTVSDFWAEDRLVDSLNIRERDYKLSVSAGPATLRVKALLLNDTTLYYAELALSGDKIKSALGRSVACANMNLSIGKPSAWNLTYTDGTILLGTLYSSSYYLVKGEVDIITVKYIASRTLTAVITDQITNPLVGYTARIRFGNQTYGSKIGKNVSQPYPDLITDSRGQIEIPYIPIGNFTVMVYDQSGNYISNQTVSSLKASNTIITPVIHFPTVILIYSGIFTAILLLGIGIYKKNTPQ